MRLCLLDAATSYPVLGIDQCLHTNQLCSYSGWLTCRSALQRMIAKDSPMTWPCWTSSKWPTASTASKRFNHADPGMQAAGCRLTFSLSRIASVLLGCAAHMTELT